MVSKKSPSADNQQANIAAEYLAGFVDGEGCFYVGFSRRKDLPLGWQVITEFHLSQNPGGKNILEAFRNRLGCGYLKLNHPKSLKDKSWVLIVKNRLELKQKLIPFFETHGLHSEKQNDLEIFKKVIGMIGSKVHLNKDGFTKVVNLVFQTNRLTKKRYSREEILSSL